MKLYMADNPRRLAIKRHHPDLFTVQRGVKASGLDFAALGNLFLLEAPLRVAVKCSRKLTEQEIAERCRDFLSLARDGAVLFHRRSVQARRRSCGPPLSKGIQPSYCSRTALRRSPSQAASVLTPALLDGCSCWLRGLTTMTTAQSRATSATPSTTWPLQSLANRRNGHGYAVAQTTGRLWRAVAIVVGAVDCGATVSRPRTGWWQ